MNREIKKDLILVAISVLLSALALVVFKLVNLPWAV